MLSITLYIMIEASAILSGKRPSNDDVDISILLGFSIANVVVDFVSIIPFYVKRVSIFYETKKFTTQTNEMNLNMISAGTHVLCDTLRTVFMLTAAIVSMAADLDGTVCDAVSAIAVSIIILFLIFQLIREIYQHTREYLSVKTANGGEAVGDDAAVAAAEHGAPVNSPMAV